MRRLNVKLLHFRLHFCCSVSPWPPSSSTPYLAAGVAGLGEQHLEQVCHPGATEAICFGAGCRAEVAAAAGLRALIQDIIMFVLFKGRLLSDQLPGTNRCRNEVLATV